MTVKNKVAIITGASSGIGKATAELLSKKGAKVVLVARNKEKLEALAKELPDSMIITADMSDEVQIVQMIYRALRHFGRIDILVNNAARGYDASIEKSDLGLVRDLFNLNFMGPLLSMQMVAPFMRKNGEGVIVNVSSASSLTHIPNMGVYAALKGALNDISITAGEELKIDHISVSVVYPYITETDFQKNTVKGRTVNVPWKGRSMQAVDSPELVAEKIVEAIEIEKPEVYVHDWLKTIH